MKKIYMLFITVFLLFSITVNAFEVVDIKPDTDFLDGLKRDVTGDITYFESIVNSYSDRYVVKKEDYLDISAIDKFYENISKPLTLKELDSATMDFDEKIAYSDELKKDLKLFKALGGLCDCKLSFEPICYYSIYRNIKLIGGYSRYTTLYKNPDDAYWIGVCRIEEMTKEIVPYNARINMLNKVRELNEKMLKDNSFKIFLLVDGKIDSIWERR